MAMSRALTKAALALWYFNLVLNLWLKAVPSEAFKNRISRTTFDRNGLERISSARWGQNGPHVTERRNMLRILRPSSDRNGGEREKNRRRSKRDGAISRNSFINTIITRLYMASSSGSGENATSRNRKSENVDLFAAGDRKILTPISPSSRTISSTPTQATVSAKSTLSSLANRTSDIGLQVELLRLEAEKEQLLIDRQRLEEEKMKLIEIDNLILKMVDGLSLDSVVTANRQLVCKELFFRLAELANVATDRKEKAYFTSLSDDLMETVQRLDVSLHAELTSDIQKELNLELNRLRSTQKNRDSENIKAYDAVLQQWLQKTMNRAGMSANKSSSVYDDANSGTSPPLMQVTIGGDPLSGMDANITGTRMGSGMIRFPAAVPINLLPFMLRSPPVSTVDLEILKKAVFAEDILNNTICDYSTFLVTFRGKPTVSIAETYAKVKRRLELVPGMSERLRVFILPEYRVQDTSNSMLEKYSGSKFEPVFTILSREAKPRTAGPGEYAFGFITLIASIITSFLYATDVNSLNADFMQRALAGDDTVVDRVIPLAFGIIGLQLIHDLGHALVAALYKVKLSIPYFLPSLQIGIFGTITNFKDFPKTRKEMFDISIAGPVFGFLASIACTLYGISMTESATPELLATFPQLPAGFLRSSLLLYQLGETFLHVTPESAADPNALLAIHPAVAIGLTGLLINAYNFIPIGRLDGGRVAMSIAGRQAANSISFAALLGQAASFITNTTPVAFFWALAVIFLQRGADIPPEDDVTPVSSDEDDNRKGFAWFGRIALLAFCTGLTALALLPVPIDPSIAPAATRTLIQGISDSQNMI